MYLAVEALCFSFNGMSLRKVGEFLWDGSFCDGIKIFEVLGD